MKFGRLLHVSIVAKQAEIHPDLKRHSQVQILFPPNTSGWVSHKELGVIMELDITKCMYSSGNGSEKARLISLIKESNRSECVVDLYAGIGYFSVPVLVHTNVSHLHMCEWNENALVALERNLKINKISTNRFTLHRGDNRLLSLENIADRVLLGLIPSSEDGWPIALRVLKPSGGWLHVHANVSEDLQTDWVQMMLIRLQEIAKCTAGKEGLCMRVCHVERVKNYAPRIVHIVVDVECSLHEYSSKFCNQLLPVNDSWSHRRPVRVIEHASSEYFWEHVFSMNVPVVLCGIDLGSAVSKWSAQYLIDVVPEKVVAVLISTDEHLNFTDRNYLIKTMTLKELITRAAGLGSTLTPSYFLDPHEKYYMRSTGDNVKDVADFSRQYDANLAKDLALPSSWIAQNRPFSSALRCSSAGVHLWTHFDISDNFLCHAVGKKRVVLFPPTDLPYLYINTSSSEVIDIDHPNFEQFPNFANSHPYECTLLPGDVYVFIVCLL